MADNNNIVLNIVTDVQPIKQAKTNIDELGASLNNLGNNTGVEALVKEVESLRIELGKTKVEYSNSTNELLKLKKIVDELRGKSDKPLIPPVHDNVKKSYDSLGMSLAQLTREAPAFANSMNTGFMAISNNLPTLFDAIRKTKLEIQAMNEQGIKAPSIWKQLGTALFSWQTALSLGVTLLTVYGGKLIELATNAFNTSKGIDVLSESKKQLNEINKKAQEDSLKEIVSMGLLFKQAKDTTATYEQRVSAIKQLRDSYPKYLQNLTDEQILAGNTKIAEDKLTESILARAKANAAITKITENQSKIIELEEKRLQLSKELAQAELDQSKAITQSQSEARYQRGEAAAYSAISSISKVAEINTSVANTEKEINDLKELNNRLSSYALVNQEKASELKKGEKQTEKELLDIQLLQYKIAVEQAKNKVILDKGSLDSKINLYNKEAELSIKTTEITIKDEKLKKATIDRINSERLKNIAELYKTELDQSKNSTNIIETYSKKQEKLREEQFNKYLLEKKQEVKVHNQSEDEKLKKSKKTKEEQQELIKQILQSSIDSFQTIADAQFQIEANRRNAMFDAQFSALDKQKEKELSNKKLTDEQKARIEEKYKKKQDAIKLQEFEANKQAAKEQAIINGALAITKIWASHSDNPILAAVLTAASVIATSAQVSVINSQTPPKFEQGGLIKGKRHSQGGTIIEAEDGEFVVNRKATAQHYNLLEQLNKGMFTPTLSVKDMANVKFISTNTMAIDYDKLATTLAKKINDRPTSIINIDERGFEKRVVTLRSEYTNNSKRYSFKA